MSLKGILVLLSFISFNNVWSKDIQRSSERTIASMKESIREVHARELLGSKYNSSMVKSLADNAEMERTVKATVKAKLPKKYQAQAAQIAETIIVESFRYELDPYFVIALISGESSFNPDSKGPVGEIGLMQLRDQTAVWIADMYKIPWKKGKKLNDPYLNIKLGTAYLNWLRNKFDGQSQLYLAAYNMGPSNVKSALKRNKKPKDYPIHVMKRYLELYKNFNSDQESLLARNVELLSSLQNTN
ncbi:MAG: lytic transglycosylase domain-containing protein [Bacteriovoracaceae bacterium]|nr:lytic transglycosylase domain-containing protein [Bacteriovoracaceae bacterium]